MGKIGKISDSFVFDYESSIKAQNVSFNRTNSKETILLDSQAPIFSPHNELIQSQDLFNSQVACSKKVSLAKEGYCTTFGGFSRILKSPSFDETCADDDETDDSRAPLNPSDVYSPAARLLQSTMVNAKSKIERSDYSFKNK